jgi:hypothetical protein
MAAVSTVSPRKLLLECSLPPGDLVVLTAAVRDLHHWHPGRFATDVRTPFPELWENNPHLTPLRAGEPEVETLVCGVRLIDHSHRLPCHYLYAFLDFLSVQLKVGLEPTEFRGDIHLSEAERNCLPPIRELTGVDAPYWLVSAGGKYDYTIKWWSVARYQEVLDSFRGRIQFVQVGRVGDHHPPLNGVVDLRGRTSLRQLIRLVHHAQGVLCGVTALMHLAAAVPRPAGRQGLRPAVILAGGREPAHWVAYPGHQVLHTIGALSCCATGGCWRARTVALGDGDPLDAPKLLCVDVVKDLPHCMHLVTGADVSRKIETFIAGGSAPVLSPTEAQAAAQAVSLAGSSRFDDLPLTLGSARLALHRFLDRLPPPPEDFTGRGIVMCGGGARYFTNAWVCLRMLRRLGCALPVQLWHLGRSEMDPAMRRLLAQLGVETVDALVVQRRRPVRRLGGWELKPYAILHSPFREVLLLDADNVPVRDPTFLFDAAPFRETGAMFWPDRGRDPKSETIWRSCGVPVPAEPEFESGQLLVDKARCWRALRLTLWFNEHSDFYYHHLYGDKDTFQVAFRTLGTSYALVPHPPRVLPGRMNQHDFAGALLFQHRNHVKWSLMPHDQRLADFRFETECLADLKHLREVWDGRRAWLQRRHPGRLATLAGRGPPRLTSLMITTPERRQVREATLADLATTDWADLPLEVLVDPDTDSDRPGRIVRQGLRALTRFLAGPADYLLFLEDDLRFNRHLRHNLERWRFLRARRVTLAGLFNPGLRELAYDVRSHAIAVDPLGTFGSLALLISRPTADHAVRHWNLHELPLDLRLPRLAADLGLPIYYHAPSLVQHVAAPSTWGGYPYQAIDFDPSWKAPSPSRTRPRSHRSARSGLNRLPVDLDP